jgi:hypothetical protein
MQRHLVWSPLRLPKIIKFKNARNVRRCTDPLSIDIHYGLEILLFADGRTMSTPAGNIHQQSVR